MESTRSFATSFWIPRLYCVVYWARRFGCSSPNNNMGRNADQSTEVPGFGVRIPLNGLGAMVRLPGPPDWLTNGVVNNPSDIKELPPKGGSPWNCSSTNCSTGL